MRLASVHTYLEADVSDYMCHVALLTRTATILLVAAIHAVRVSITPPTDGDAVSVLTLELVVVTLQIAAMLKKIVVHRHRG